MNRWWRKPKKMQKNYWNCLIKFIGYRSDSSNINLDQGQAKHNKHPDGSSWERGSYGIFCYWNAFAFRCLNSWESVVCWLILSSWLILVQLCSYYARCVQSTHFITLCVAQECLSLIDGIRTMLFMCLSSCSQLLHATKGLFSVIWFSSRSCFLVFNPKEKFRGGSKFA